MVQAGMIPIQMELGGKDACIVCHDADIDLAAKNIVKVHDTALHCMWSSLSQLCWLSSHCLSIPAFSLSTLTFDTIPS